MSDERAAGQTAKPAGSRPKGLPPAGIDVSLVYCCALQTGTGCKPSVLGRDEFHDLCLGLHLLDDLEDVLFWHGTIREPDRVQAALWAVEEHRVVGFQEIRDVGRI